MLVLTAKRNERILITTPEGKEIWVAVAEIRGDKVRLGFVADRDVLVQREAVVARSQTHQTVWGPVNV